MRFSWQAFLVRHTGVILALILFNSCLHLNVFGEEPTKVTLCQLKKDPAAYNHKLIQVTSFVSHGFEDFALFEPGCPAWPGVWLEYGGATASGTMYCCGVTAARTRPKPLVVEKIPIPLTGDAVFREFDALIQKTPDTVVHATLIGRFFSGQQIEYPGGKQWSGYGHMGCCTLLAIQQVVSVDPHSRDDLDYGASADQPELGKVNCGYRYLTAIQPYQEMTQTQQNAENRSAEWVFSDPQKVATKALAQILNIEEAIITGIKLTRQAPGRMVYQWQPTDLAASYMVVVSRPYWLSFYAKDPQKVAWVVAAAYKSSCEADNNVTLLLSTPANRTRAKLKKKKARHKQ